MEKPCSLENRVNRRDGSASRTERRLAHALRKSKMSAWEEFYGRYGAAIYRFALARTNGDADAAADAAHEAVVAAIESIGRFDPRKGALWPWLCGIATNKLREAARRNGRDLRLGRALREGAGAAAPSANSDAAMDVECVLSRLHPQHQEVLEYKYIQGLSVREMAATLRISEKAAESRLTRARAAFRDAHKRHDDIVTEIEDG